MFILKNGFKTPSIFCACLILCLGASAHAFDNRPLPPSWYLLPEDGGPTISESEVGFDSYSSGARKSFERLHSLNEGILEKVPLRQGNTRRPLNAPGKWAPWHLENVILDLAISGQGSLGVLVLKGQAAASFYWRRKTAKSPTHYYRSNHETGADFVLHSDLSESQIRRGMEPVVRSVMATGKVANERRLRAELYHQDK